MNNILSEDLKIKQHNLLLLLAEAIKIIEKYLKRLRSEHNPKYDLLIISFERCVKNLNDRVKLITENENFFKEQVNIPAKKRGSFGLLQGFGEFTYGDKAMEHEIIESIYKIENYFRIM
jgi:hypothetical protein